MAEGIRDKVAVLGMGCSKFGERWDKGAEDLIFEAYEECLEDAGIETSQIDTALFSTFFGEAHVGKSGLPLASALRLPNIPVTHVENFCASGSEAFRGAVLAVAAGASDFALAVGVEKLKDTGSGGLPSPLTGSLDPMWIPEMTPAGTFAQVAKAYQSKYRLDFGDLKRAMAHISVKSHQNGSKNPKAHLRREIDEATALNAPIIADPLGLYDCCGVSDGAACAIVTTPEIAKDLGKDQIVTVKATQIATSNGTEALHNSWDGTYFLPTRVAAKRAYQEAGIKVPKNEIGMVEVHDCFSITELIVLEDLQLVDEGQGIHAVMDGVFDADGKIPCQIDGGLKCFGHPIGATGLRQIYEMYLQLQGKAGDRQLNALKFGLTHNLGGWPNQNVSSVTIIGHMN